MTSNFQKLAASALALLFSVTGLTAAAQSITAGGSTTLPPNTCIAPGTTTGTPVTTYQYNTGGGAALLRWEAAGDIIIVGSNTANPVSIRSYNREIITNAFGYGRGQLRAINGACTAISVNINKTFNAPNPIEGQTCIQAGGGYNGGFFYGVPPVISSLSQIN